MKKTIATLAIVALLALTGCATTEPDKTENDNLHESSVHLSDGRTVICIVRGDSTRMGRGGLSCDWAGAK